MNDMKVFDKIVEKAGGQYEYSKETLKMIKPFLKGRILDLGCGAGDVAKAFPEDFKDSFGVDISPKSVEIADNYYRMAIVADLRNDMPFKANYFDTILLISTLHHVPDNMLHVLREAKRMLKPGGQIVIFDHNANNGHIRRMHSGILRLVPSKTERALYPNDIKNIANLLGLEITNFKAIEMHAEQMALKMPFPIRIIKVLGLWLTDLFDKNSVKNDFLMVLEK